MAAASAPGMTEPTQPKLVPNRMARTTRSPAARLRRRLYMGYPRSGRDRYTAVARAQKEKTPQRGRSGAPSRRPFSGCRCRHDSMALPGLEPGRGVAPLDFESSASTVPPEGPISKYPTRKIICVHRASSISIGQTWGRRSIVTNALPGEDRNAKAADELFAGRGPARRDGARPQASERSHCASHRGYGGRARRPSRRSEITRWIADRRARRVPKFVIEMTGGLDTKKKIVAKYGEDVVFERGKPLPRTK